MICAMSTRSLRSLVRIVKESVAGSMPASLKRALAFSTSRSCTGSSSLIEYFVEDGIRLRGVLPTPRNTAFWMPTVSRAAKTAWRKRTSLKGAFVVLKPM